MENNEQQGSIPEGIESTALSSPMDLEEMEEKESPQEKKNEEPKQTKETKEETPKGDKGEEGSPEGASPEDKPQEQGKPQSKETEKKETKEEDFVPTENPAYNVAKIWQEEGRLPEDLEIKEDITDGEVEEMYRSHLENSYKPQIEESYLAELREKGYSEKDLETARLVNQGVDPKEIIKRDDYQQFANYKLSEDEKERDREADYLLRLYYQDANPNFSKDKIDKLIKLSVQENTLDKDVEEAQTYFSKKAEEQTQQMKQRAEQVEKQKQERIEKTRNRINNYIKTRKVGDKEYSKEDMSLVDKALHKKTEVVEVDGKKYRATLWDRIRHEVDNDPDLDMQRIINTIKWWNGYDEKEMEEEIEDRVKRKIFTNMNGSRSSTPKGDNNEAKDIPGSIERRELV